eukprot:TRINITY_DN4295_c0_g1_i3.p1 TRINITY_DN4295_c0_g1~~TRINITY_DN4295_c0_g1_i3.p1  ORF type:complete len:128 (+),score=8.82 TRINITY_DN4295_c0_g1_i3:195-578(+)
MPKRQIPEATEPQPKRRKASLPSCWACATPGATGCFGKKHQAALKAIVEQAPSRESMGVQPSWLDLATDTPVCSTTHPHCVLAYLDGKQCSKCGLRSHGGSKWRTMTAPFSSSISVQFSSQFSVQRD